MEVNDIKLSKKGFQMKWMERISKQIGVLCLYPQKNFEILYINELLLLELKYESQEAFQRRTDCSVLGIVHPDELKAFRDFLYLETEYPENPKFQCRLRCSDYSFVWYEMSRIHCLDQEQNPMLLCTLVNISQYMETRQTALEMEKEMQEAVDKMEATIQNIPGGYRVLRLNEKPSIEYASDSFYGMCGFRAEQMSGDVYGHYLQLLNQKDRSQFEKVVEDLKRYPHKKQLEYQIQQKDGSAIWVSDTLQSFRNSGGEMFAYSSIEDIQKWRMAWQKLRGLTNEVPFGIISCKCSIEDGIVAIDFFNDAFCRITGILKEQLEHAEGDLFKHMFSPGEWEVLLEKLKTAESGKVCMDQEFGVLCGDQEKKVRIAVKVVERQEKFWKINATFLDVTEQRITEGVLKFQDYFARNMDGFLANGFMVKRLGEEQEILYATCNIRTFLHAHSVSYEKMKISGYETMIHEEDYVSIRMKLQQYKKQLPMNFELEFRAKGQDGTFVWIKVIARRLYGFTSEDTYLFWFEDISRMKKIQEILSQKEEEYRVAALHNGEIVVRLEIKEKMAYIPKELAIRYQVPEKISNMPYQLLETGYILPESIAEYLKFYRKTVRGVNSTTELKTKGLDGVERWLYGKSTVRCDETGQAVMAIMSFTDMTEQKEKEKRLENVQQSERFFQKVAELSDRIILRYEYQTDRLMPVTQRSHRIFEKFSEPLSPLGLVNSKLIADEYLNEVHKAFYKIKKETTDGKLYIKVKALKKEDEWKWYRCTYHVVLEQDKRPEYAVIFCDDITTIRDRELAAQCFWNHLKTENKKPFLSLIYNLSLDAFEKSDGEIPHYYKAGVTKSYSKAADWMCGQVLPEYREKFRLCFSKERLFGKLEQGENQGGGSFLIRYEEETICIRTAYQIIKDPYTTDIAIWIRCQDIEQKKDIEIIREKEEHVQEEEKEIYIRTFGYFGIFVNGAAVPIQNAKARELLAFLVDKRGGYASAEEILSALWEEEPISTRTLTRVRKTVMILKNTLKEYTSEEIIESKGGLRRLNVEVVNCDLYDFLSGKEEYASLYQGIYMPNYSWSEVTIPELDAKRVPFS